MSELPVPPATFAAMVRRGALVRTAKHSFTINFHILKEEFPEFLETFVLENLNETEHWAYKNGFMAFEVLPNGDLFWKYTGKTLKDLL